MLIELSKKSKRKRKEDRPLRKRRLSIAFDIDGVFVDVHNVFSKIILSRYRIDTFYPQQYDVTVGNKLTTEQLWEAIREAYLLVDETPIYSGSTELVSTLHNVSGDEITFITARPVEFENETAEIVERFCHVPYKIIFSKGSDKINYLNDFNYFVDDRRKTARQLAANGKKVFMPVRSYNRLCKNDSDCIIEISSIRSLTRLMDIFFDEWIVP